MISAGLIFLIAGLIIFFVMNDKALAYFGGLLSIFFGTFMAGFSLIALAVFLTIWAVKKSKDKKNNSNN